MGDNEYEMVGPGQSAPPPPPAGLPPPPPVAALPPPPPPAKKEKAAKKEKRERKSEKKKTKKSKSREGNFSAAESKMVEPSEAPEEAEQRPDSCDSMQLSLVSVVFIILASGGAVIILTALEIVSIPKIRLMMAVPEEDYDLLINL